MMMTMMMMMVMMMMPLLTDRGRSRFPVYATTRLVGTSHAASKEAAVCQATWLAATSAAVRRGVASADFQATDWPDDPLAWPASASKAPCPSPPRSSRSAAAS